jgi:prepilin-type N-terminal cleavage/methylation domain-containing protein
VTRHRHGGFSLVEALIALALSGIILTLVSTVFFAQNRFYADASRRSDLQESVRSAGELIAGDVRGLTGGGIVVAESDRMVVRTPLALGIICGPASYGRSAFFGFEGAPPPAESVQGWGVRAGTGSWSYAAATWDELVASTGGSDEQTTCGAAGADTSGPTGDFVHLIPDAGAAGDVVMLFSEIALTFDDSELQGGRRALFRGVNGETLREFATGFSSDSRFEYRLGGAWESQVTGASNLSQIDAVRVVVRAVSGAAGGPFGWSIDIPLRNTN